MASRTPTSRSRPSLNDALREGQQSIRAAISATRTAPRSAVPAPPPQPPATASAASLADPPDAAESTLAAQANEVFAEREIPLFLVCSSRGYSWRRIAKGQPCVPGRENSYSVTRDTVRRILRDHGLAIDWRYGDASSKSPLHQIVAHGTPASKRKAPRSTPASCDAHDGTSSEPVCATSPIDPPVPTEESKPKRKKKHSTPPTTDTDRPTTDHAPIYGRDTIISTPAEEIEARYAIIELDSLIPSHDAWTFAPNPNYPGMCQQRDYTNDHAEQAKVIQNANAFKPRFLVADTPTATDGAPVVTTLGIVLGGNSRVMSVERLENYDLYRSYLIDHAETFGFTARKVEKFQKPFLIREVSIDIRRCATYSNILNRGLTQNVDITTETISFQRQLTPRALEQIAAAFSEADTDTISAALSNRPTADRILAIFRQAGIITTQNQSQWIDPSTTTLSDLGRMMVEKVLLARILPDKKLIDAARSYTTQLVKTIPLLIRMQQIGDAWDLTPSIEEAIRQESKRRATGTPKDVFIKSIDAFDAPIARRVELIWNALDAGARAWSSYLDAYVTAAEKEAQGGAFDFQIPMSPDDLLEAGAQARGLADNDSECPIEPPVLKHPATALRTLGDELIGTLPINDPPPDPDSVEDDPDDDPPASSIIPPTTRTAAEISRLRIPRRPLPKEWLDLFGEIPFRCTWFVYGPGGSGKSTLALKFVGQALPRSETILWVNAEQRQDAGGMTDRILRAGAARTNITIVDTRDPTYAEELIASGAYSFVIIDSVNRLRDCKINDIVKWLYRYTGTSFILIGHVDKTARKYKGPTDLEHDPEVVVYVDKTGLARTEKNHYGKPGTMRIFQDRG